jgi:hypothetical protein
MRGVLAPAALSSALVVSAHAAPINLPGALSGGVQVCTPAKCLTTPYGRETPVQVLSFQDGIANIRLGTDTMGADPNQLLLKLPGCTLTLRSYLAKRYCAGWKPPHTPARSKAEQCRRLAACIPTRDDPTAVSLDALSLEFDAAATAIDAQTETAQAIGYGESVPPNTHRPRILN